MSTTALIIAWIVLVVVAVASLIIARFVLDWDMVEMAIYGVYVLIIVAVYSYAYYSDIKMCQSEDAQIQIDIFESTE